MLPRQCQYPVPLLLQLEDVIDSQHNLLSATRCPRPRAGLVIPAWSMGSIYQTSALLKPLTPVTERARSQAQASMTGQPACLAPEAWYSGFVPTHPRRLASFETTLPCFHFVLVPSKADPDFPLWCEASASQLSDTRGHLLVSNTDAQFPVFRLCADP